MKVFKELTAFLEMGKRGLSNIVVMILLILLVLAAVIIIWAFARTFVFEGSSSIEEGLFLVGFRIPSGNVKVDSDRVSFKLERRAGKAELVAVNVVLEDVNKNTCVSEERFDTPMNELESRVITKSYGSAGSDCPDLGELAKISVAPVVLNEVGKELKGEIAVSYKVRDSNFVGFGCVDNAILCNPNTQVCDYNSGECVECTENNDVHCDSGEKCESNVCVPDVPAGPDCGVSDSICFTSGCTLNNDIDCGDICTSNNDCFGGQCSNGGVCVDISPMNTNPILHWEFNENSWSGSTGEVLDSSENNYFGTAKNGANTGSSSFGDFGVFSLDINDVADDYVESGGGIPIQSFTVMAWARQADSVRTGFILGQSPDSGPNDKGIIFGYSQENDFWCGFVYGDDNNLLFSNDGINYDKLWHHWACTYDSVTGDGMLYLDGKLFQNVPGDKVGQKNLGAGYSNSGKVNVGRSGWLTNDVYFRGRIDEVKIYGRVLGASEISGNM